MLKIKIPSMELWDEGKEEFIYTKEQVLQMEHSLVSISKWEQKYHKPFLSSDKTIDEIIDYIRFMTITQNVNDLVFQNFPKKSLEEILKYIEDPMTATTFNENQKKPPNSREIITSELVYYWMVAYQIPFECQKWHINRLLTLIRICDIKNAPPKKMSKSDIMSRNKALNAARKAKYNTHG